MNEPHPETSPLPHSTTTSEETILSVNNGIAELRFNRPLRRNSFTAAFMESLLLSIEHVMADPAVRVVILTGDEQCFSVGGDLNEFATGIFAPATLTPKASAAVLRRHARAVELLRGSDKISIAAIGGACAGAGLAIAAACDIRIATRTSVFRAAFIDAGLASDYGAIWLVTRLLGEARAKDLFLLNPKITAKRALEIGLVSQLVETAELHSTVVNIARTLTTKAPLALSATKHLFSSLPTEVEAALDQDSLIQKRCAYSADALEAAHAFLERRSPRYSGH